MSVSVIITTFNDGEYLSGCLDSVAAQTLAPREVIVVDDGTTSAEALAGIDAALAAHPQARLHRQPNQGPSAARNRGLEVASGEYVAFLDVDDRWAPENLERRLAFFRREEPIVAAYCGYVDQLAEGPGRRSVFREHRGVLPADLLGVPDGIPGGLPLYLLRRQAIRDAGGLDPALSIMEDFDLLLRIGRQGALFAGNNDPLYVRNVRPGSLTRASADRLHRGTLQFLRKAARERYFSRPELARRYAYVVAAGMRRRIRSAFSGN